MFDIMAADYIQPDISHAGGIMELKKIAAEAESRYIPFAPHNPSGPVANAATLQLAASCPNFEILEIMYSDVDYRKDITNESLEYKDGYITIPDKAGLGIEINEEECLKHPYRPHTLRHYTGALTDIRPAKTDFNLKALRRNLKREISKTANIFHKIPKGAKHPPKPCRSNF